MAHFFPLLLFGTALAVFFFYSDGFHGILGEAWLAVRCALCLALHDLLDEMLPCPTYAYQFMQYGAEDVRE